MNVPYPFRPHRPPSEAFDYFFYLSTSPYPPFPWQIQQLCQFYQAPTVERPKEVGKEEPIIENLDVKEEKRSYAQIVSSHSEQVQCQPKKIERARVVVHTLANHNMVKDTKQKSRRLRRRLPRKQRVGYVKETRKPRNRKDARKQKDTTKLRDRKDVRKQKDTTKPRESKVETPPEKVKEEIQWGDLV